MTKISRRDFTALALAGVAGVLVPTGLEVKKCFDYCQKQLA